MNIEVTSNLNALAETLVQYIVETGKAVDDVLEKKGRDLSIQLFKAFQGKEWGGVPKQQSIAWDELEKRTSARLGTMVRRSLREEYAEVKSSLKNERLFLAQRSHGQKFSSGDLRELRDNKKRQVNAWQRIVGKEIAMRQRGIGFLAAGWLWFRSRSSSVSGTYYVRNKTGRVLGGVIKTEGQLQIINAVAGASVISDRYDLVNKAIGSVIADTRTYLIAAHAKAYAAAFKSLGAEAIAA